MFHLLFYLYFVTMLMLISMCVVCITGSCSL